MPIPLWTLLWLNARAVARRATRSMRTPRGIVFGVIGVLLILLWLGGPLLMRGHQPAADPAAVRTVGPIAVALMCLLNVLTSAGERAVSFSPAEVDFLFPGPFTRRQLLAYKLIKTGLGTIPAALVFGIVLGRFGGSFLGRVVAAWLLFQFVQMIAMTAALVQATVGEQSFTRGRKWFLAAVLAAAAAVVGPTLARQGWDDPRAIATHVNATPLGRVALAPFGLFAKALVAPRLWPDGVGLDAVAAVLVAALVGVVVLLDANYLETAATVSGKRYATVARMRRSGLAGMSVATSGKFRLPMLPWLGGAGPVAWRQLTGVLRTSRGLLLVLGLIALVGGVSLAKVAHQPSRHGPHTGGADKAGAVLGVLAGVSVWTNLFLTSMLKFDFRGDLDHLDALRALPLRPTAVAAAEVVAPTLVLSAVQWVLVAAVAAGRGVPVGWLLGMAAFVVPINALLVGSENLLFLLFPSRQAVAVAGDMGSVGRQTVLFLCRLLALVIVLGVAGAVGLGAGYVTGRSFVVGGVVAWLAVVAAVVGVVRLMGLTFERFDPSVDTPA